MRRSSYTEKELRDKGVCLSHLVVDDMTSGLYGRTLGVCVFAARVREKERARSDAQPASRRSDLRVAQGPAARELLRRSRHCAAGPGLTARPAHRCATSLLAARCAQQPMCAGRADRAGIVYRLDQFKITVAFEEYPDDAPTTSVSLIRLANEM
jgi:hypothetical protein